MPLASRRSWQASATCACRAAPTIWLMPDRGEDDGEWRAGTLIECRRLFTPHLATICASLTLSTSGVPLTGDIVPLSVGGPRGRRAAVS
jgi:hypothetical protein